MSINFSSKEFLIKLQTCDTSTFELLVRTYTKQLINASFGLGFSETDAHEVVQSVWVTLFIKLPTFEGRSHIRTYIFGILYNKAKELKRDRNKHTSATPFEEIMEDKFDPHGNWKTPPMEPDKFIEATQTIDIIEHCMSQLPTQQRMAFHLKEVIGENTPDICKILDISSTNLGVLLYRAKNKLRDCIERKNK